MFPERRLLDKGHNVFNTIVVKEMCVIVVVKVLNISQPIVNTLPEFPESMPVA